MSTAPVPEVEAFYHALTGAFAYIVFDARTRRAAIIDAVLDFDRRSGQVGTEAADRLLDRLRELGLTVDWVLETHAHADHLSAAGYLKDRLQCTVATGTDIRAVQANAARLFGLGPEFGPDGSQFDRLLGDGDRLEIGGLTATVIATPGHTPDSVTYLIGDCLFVGDTLFLPEQGTARCDFPGASAARLYESVRRLYALPDHTRVMVGHDYPPPEREARHSSDIAAEKAGNVHLNERTTAEAFVAFREERDRTLPLPELYFFALQVNVRAGRLPREAGAVSFRVPAQLPGSWGG